MHIGVKVFPSRLGGLQLTHCHCVYCTARRLRSHYLNEAHLDHVIDPDCELPLHGSLLLLLLCQCCLRRLLSIF